MARLRDYKAEYARRIARGLAKGLTRAQARGHPEVGKPLVSGKLRAASYDRELEEGIKMIRKGHPLGAAAKSINVSAERLRNYVVAQSVGEKVGGRWKIGLDTRKRAMVIYSAGKEQPVILRGYESSRLAGEYMNAVKNFLAYNDPAHLAAYKGTGVVDANGKYHPFETDPNILYKLTATSDRPYEKVYRIVQ